MVDLKKLFPQSVGADMEIRVKVLFTHPQIGSGKFSKITSSEADFSGKASILGHEVKADLSFVVTSDTEVTATVNGTKLDATYTTSGSGSDLKMHIKVDTHGEKGTIDIYLEDTDETGIDVDLSGKVGFSHTLYIEPA